MAPRPIRLLHVEDDPVQRRLVAAHLSKLCDFRFSVEHAGSEDEAVEKFRGGFDCVLLDYNLDGGDGLNCLRRLRDIDQAAPVIAVSGVATPEIAAELLEAGADDYLPKSGLDTDTLAKSMRAALARADAYRQRAPDLDPEVVTELAARFRGLCDEVVTKLGPGFLARVEALEAAGRKARLTTAQTMRFFETACDAVSDSPARTASVKQLFRPVMFELVYRLFGETPTGAPQSVNEV